MPAAAVDVTGCNSLFVVTFPVFGRAVLVEMWPGWFVVKTGATVVTAGFGGVSRNT